MRVKRLDILVLLPLCQAALKGNQTDADDVSQKDLSVFVHN